MKPIGSRLRSRDSENETLNAGREEAKSILNRRIEEKQKATKTVRILYSNFESKQFEATNQLSAKFFSRNFRKLKHEKEEAEKDLRKSIDTQSLGMFEIWFKFHPFTFA